MDKYQQLRADGERLMQDVLGKSTEDAHALCVAAGFALRYTKIDGRPCMITADSRMDRVSAAVSNGHVYAAHVG
jgi:hypothetical protein